MAEPATATFKQIAQALEERPGERREEMLFALGWLRNISLASLAAECQDSVCKQSGHVHVLTWRKLLSLCPRRLTPEVNPDIDTCSQGQQHSLRPSATQTALSLPAHNYTGARLTRQDLFEKEPQDVQLGFTVHLA